MISLYAKFPKNLKSKFLSLQPTRGEDTIFRMSVRVDVPIERVLSLQCSQEKAFEFVSDPEKNIPQYFPGIERLEKISDDTYRWVFRGIEYSGYKIELSFSTRFIYERYNKISLEPPMVGGTTLRGQWIFSPSSPGSQAHFKAVLSTELPIPFFLKGVATSLAQKEFGKIFGRYLKNVESALSKQ